MDDPESSLTLAVALVSGGSALIGAVVGAVAAVVGPALVARQTSKSLAASSAREARRQAILAWSDAAFAAAAARPPSPDLIVRHNQTLTILDSQFGPNDVAANEFVYGVSHRMFQLRHSRARFRLIAFASRRLLRWQRGEKNVLLDPFAVTFVDGKNIVVGLSSWDDPITADEDPHDPLKPAKSTPARAKKSVARGKIGQ